MSFHLSIPESSERPSLLARLHLAALSCLILFACGTPPERAPDAIVLYPPAPAPPRIQFLTSIGSDDDLDEAESSLDDLLFGEQQAASKVIQTAYGCAAHDGKIFVCDPRLQGVIVIDLAKQTMDPLPADGRGSLVSPINLAFAPDGRLYVADSVRGQVVVFGPDLRYEAEFGPFGENSRPVDVEVTADRLYVIDILTKLVHVLDRRSGEELFSFGQRQVSAEVLVAPTNLTIDAEGNVYIVDTIRCEVIVFNSEGEYLKTIGVLGDGAGAFARPKGIAYADDLLFVIDAAFANCQVMDMDGTPLMYFGGGGNGPGQMYLPAAVWVGTEGLELFEDELEATFQADRLIITTNQYGPRKVSFYALGKDSRFDYEAYEEQYQRKRDKAIEEAALEGAALEKSADEEQSGG